MNVRLGYVAISLSLDNCSTSKTTTLSTLGKLPDSKAVYSKLHSILAQNLNNLMQILEYNRTNNMYVYRISSKLVPFATHNISSDWDYISQFKSEFSKIGQFIKENRFRISMHPDHFTIINAYNKDIFNKSIKDLIYLNSLFEAMSLDNNYKLVIHVGGLYGNKNESKKRFINNFRKLPKAVRNRIILENDDKSYTISDVLEICNILKIPMVLDVHHHYCNNNGENLEDFLLPIFNTWNKEMLPPKIHFSSPRNQTEFRSHRDDIISKDFIKFIKQAKKLSFDFDIMLEAKNKDLALFKLMEDIKKEKGIIIINQSEFIF